MVKLLISALILVGLSCMVHGESLEVKIKPGFNHLMVQKYEPYVIEDWKTVKEVVVEALYWLQISFDKYMTLETPEGVRYDMDKTIKEAGIRKGDKLVLKYRKYEIQEEEAKNSTQ